MNESALSVRYRWVVVAFGLLIVIVINDLFPPVNVDWRGYIFFIALIVASELVYIPLPSGSLNVTFAVLLPLFLFYGTVMAVTLYGLGNFIGLSFRRRGLSQTLFNACQLAISTAMGSCGYYWVTREPVFAKGPGLSASLLGIGTFILAFLITNHTLVNISLELQRDGRLDVKNMLSESLEPIKWDLLMRILTTPLGVLLTWMYMEQGIPGAAIISVPLLFVAYVFRLHLSLSMANRELTILYNVAQRIGSVLELEKLFELMADAVERIVKYDTLALYLWDELAQELSMMMIKHPTPDIFTGSSIRLGEGIIGAVAASREPEVVPDAMKDARVKYHPDDRYPSRSVVVVPLIVEDELVGVVMLGRRVPNAFTQEHLRMLTILCSQAAVAIENAILYRRTEQLAITDPMTGLYNYRYFYSRLSEELKRVKATNSQLSLIYLDLDGFKQYNDTYGHPVGDQILRDFADILRQMVRDTDTPMRYAGDEFVVLLPNTSVKEAQLVAERIRRAVEQHEFLADQYPDGLRLTMSAGISNYPQHASSEVDLIYRADQAMYLSKREGTNRVFLASKQGRSHES